MERQKDKVTVWLNTHWYPCWQTEGFIPMMTLARLINEVDTLAYVGFHTPWQRDLLLERLVRWRDAGNRVFNPAYIVTTCGKKMDKLVYVLDVASTVDRFVKLPKADSSLADMYDQLTSIDGLGAGFLAAQIIADLKYTPLLCDAPDWSSWCVPGPGSQRGLNRLMGLGATSKKWPESVFRGHVNALQEIIAQETTMPLHAQDVQNCLCEFDKYMRAREGGRPKQNYHGR